MRVICEAEYGANVSEFAGEAGVSECLLSFRSAQAEDRDRDRHRLFVRSILKGLLTLIA